VSNQVDDDGSAPRRQRRRRPRPVEAEARDDCDLPAVALNRWGGVKEQDGGEKAKPLKKPEGYGFGRSKATEVRKPRPKQPPKAQAQFLQREDQRRRDGADKPEPRATSKKKQRESKYREHAPP
jgi:hypothetical protein